MHKELNKLLWFSDLHFSPIFFTRFLDFIRKVKQSNVDGVFLTGDISEGQVHFWLERAAQFLDCPIYFVLGNHDYYLSSFDETEKKVREVCQKYPNLIWTDEQTEPIRLTEEVALIGSRGWYSADLGNINYLRWTFDWFLIKELRELPNLQNRVIQFQKMAEESAIKIKEQLEKAIEQDYKTIYILTHMPPFPQAIRAEGTIFESFWMPYNVNHRMGKVIEEAMKDHKKRNVVVCAGHIHLPEFIRISRNIVCQVGKPCNLLSVEFQTIYT